MNTPMGVLLPVLGVMSVTSEWSQRTAMVTFTLEPSRSRVIAAKFASLMIVSVAALVIGLVMGVIANLLYGAFSGNDVVWGSPAKYAFYYLLLYVFGMATGFAFGALLLNSPAGIVVYFVYSVRAAHPVRDRRGPDELVREPPAVDRLQQRPERSDRRHDRGKDWAHLLVSGLLWLALPLAVGIWRIQRRRSSEHPDDRTFDVSATPGIPFGRLFAVELRKTVDTRAGRWLIGITVGLALLAKRSSCGVVAAQDDAARSATSSALSAFVSSVLLPVARHHAGDQRVEPAHAMTTFTLEPRRTRIVLAKLLAGVALTAFVVVFALVIGLICTLLYGALQGPIDWTFGWSGFFGFVINQTFAMLGGFALACLLLNTPAAIVAFFAYRYVLPTLLAIGSALMDWFSHLAPWIDFQSASAELYDMPLTGSQWGHLAVSGSSGSSSRWRSGCGGSCAPR